MLDAPTKTPVVNRYWDSRIVTERVVGTDVEALLARRRVGDAVSTGGLVSDLRATERYADVDPASLSADTGRLAEAFVERGLLGRSSRGTYTLQAPLRKYRCVAYKLLNYLAPDDPRECRCCRTPDLEPAD